MLADTARGEVFEITSVTDSEVRARLLRLGFLDGDVECYRRVANGPVVLRRTGTTLAVGRAIAEEITIDPKESK